MKKIKTSKMIKQGDYIRAVKKNGTYIVFKAEGRFKFNNLVTIVDTNIQSLVSMVGKEEYMSRFTLDNEFTLYKLNKFERWVYEL